MSFNVWYGYETRLIYIPYHYNYSLSVEKYWNPHLVHYLFSKVSFFVISYHFLNYSTLEISEIILANCRIFSFLHH